MGSRRYSPADLALLRSNPGAVLPAPKKRRWEEAEMERALHRWWRDNHALFNVPRCVLFKITNEGARGVVGGKLAKLAGMAKGAPDQMLAVPRFTPFSIAGVAVPRCIPALFLELKRPGGIVSEEQRMFHEVLRLQGYKVEVVTSLQDAINVVTTYLTK